MAKKTKKGGKNVKSKKSKPKGKPKQRDYKAEYRARVKRALDEGYSRRVARGHAGKRELGIKLAKKLDVKPGSDPFKIVRADAVRVFGSKPKYTAADGNLAGYQLRLAEMAEREGVFDWTDEGTFIEQLQELGFSEREAYTLWVSP